MVKRGTSTVYQEEIIPLFKKKGIRTQRKKKLTIQQNKCEIPRKIVKLILECHHGISSGVVLIFVLCLLV